MEFKKLVENYTHRIVDENQNKWEVIEISDLKDICEQHSKEKRYAVTSNFYIWAESDEEALKRVKELEEVEFDSHYRVLSVHDASDTFTKPRKIK